MEHNSRICISTTKNKRAMQRLEALNKELLEKGGGEQDTDLAAFDPASEEDTGEPE